MIASNGLCSTFTHMAVCSVDDTMRKANTDRLISNMDVRAIDDTAQ